MFDAPMDGVLAWIGLAACSIAVAGVAVSLPTTAPPAASAVAAQVDEVATSEHRVAATVSLRADEIRIRATQLSLRTDGVTAHARVVGEGVVAAETEGLAAVLAGRDPERVYADRAAFERDVAQVRDGTETWRPAPDTLQIRRVTWGDVDATVVG